MESHLHHNKSKFVIVIIESLHMKADTFMYNLAHHHPYEMLLYVWINKLYTKGKSIDDAIQLIYKARNILLLNKGHIVCNDY
ncbi:hypothetical protein [Aquimarina macrocephali]|uniref:hypothetical protein n=1 Tax=Aquimarina macrocephali TaxID=666563 RepID=UPI003F681821